MSRFHNVIQSPIGPITTVVDATEALVAISFGGVAPTEIGEHDARRTGAVDAQLAEYFAGQRRRFDLRFAELGTPFQRRVWDALCEIPFGETRSYLDIARRIGSPDAVRAVGQANGRNPRGIVVPCHRVIGSNGTLTGYAGGLSTKDALLRFERTGSIAEPSLFGAAC